MLIEWNGNVEFYGKVRDGYLHLARSLPDRFFVVDGLGDVDDIEIEIWTKSTRAFGTNNSIPHNGKSKRSNFLSSATFFGALFIMDSFFMGTTYPVWLKACSLSRLILDLRKIVFSIPFIPPSRKKISYYSRGEDPKLIGELNRTSNRRVQKWQSFID